MNRPCKLLISKVQCQFHWLTQSQTQASASQWLAWPLAWVKDEVRLSRRLTLSHSLGLTQYRYIQTVIMMGFFVFFQDLCEFVIHCNKRHIFLCLFVLLAQYYSFYWWKWSHYCRIKKVIFFEWHFYHLFRGFPSLDFSQLWKMVPALAFNSIIVATSAWSGKWNRHAVVPSANFFYAGAILNFL